MICEVLPYLIVTDTWRKDHGSNCVFDLIMRNNPCLDEQGNISQLFRHYYLLRGS